MNTSIPNNSISENNGITKEQIKDVFLQVTVYCGAPAGIDSMRLAREVFEETNK